MDTQKAKTFIWYGDDSKKAFPIDYTMQELATRLDPAKSKSVSIVSLKNAVASARLLSTLRSIQLSASSKSDSFTVPLEAAPLLACLVALTENKTYKEMLTKNFAGSPNLRTDFLNELCIMLYKETEKSENSTAKYIDPSFARHILFHNARFREGLTAQLWEHEITERFHMLQALAKKRQLGSQLHIFLDCLTSLDRCILELKTQSSSLSSEEEQCSEELPELKQLLYQLLSARNPDSPIGATSKIRSYSVSNIGVGNQRMEEVFQQLQKAPAKPDLLNLARKRYLGYIAKGLENKTDKAAQQALQIEQLYDDTLRYLKITSSDIGKAELQNIIEEHCIYQCGLVVNYCTFNGSKMIPPFFPMPSYTTTLLDRLIQEEINSKLDLFRETIQLMAYYSAVASGSWQQQQFCIVRLEQYITHDRNIPEIPISKVMDIPIEVETADQNPYYKEMCNFLEFWGRTWTFLHLAAGGLEEIFDKENRTFVNVDYLASELFSIGTTAAIKLNKEDLMFSSLDETLASLRCYESLLQNCTLVNPAYIYHHTISRLFLVMLMAILLKITRDVKSALVDKLILLPGLER